MKVFPFKIPKTQNIGLIYQEDKEEVFYDKLHQHEEIQICAIIKGEGTLIVADTVSDYKTGDILVIGSNLPHVFKSDTTAIKESFMISLFFTKKSFGKSFFELDDFKELQNFFSKSISGLRIMNNQTKIINQFLLLQHQNNLERFINFFKILNIINKSKSSSLSNFIYPRKYTDNEGKRMRNIMDYTIHNFDKNIDLDTIANEANMTPNAFCRYFKQRTNKTYFTFLNELRIENACKLLGNNNELTISEIAYQSGFKNLSNFNRKFKDYKKVAPRDYRKVIA
ncbi:cupin [Tenacibaculum holothuriorum]|uniref:Cupin n=1 Tax=Tenacibaculum holothuriorum TaxID=1635173 RepID=A0A1Y2PA44_9FLAO|nr:AraC family transcriptional regulator [Tenacibaculum holothuriorum]OSY87325.1 cupin [Tenacibaculum holothuriorum]